MNAAGRLAAAVGIAVAVAAAVGAGEVVPRAAHADTRPAAMAQGSQDPVAEELLRAHNEWRRKVGVSPLRWAPDVAETATSRARRLAADGCTLEHDLLDDLGENLLRLSAFRRRDGSLHLQQIRPAQVVEAWAAESVHYSYERNRCEAGRDCLHYTQMVWAATEELGCGTAACPAGGLIWVCNYRPPGNIRGERPY